LRDLHAFFAVVQSGTKAAAQLRVKQPSVSKTIDDLEGVLGARHFDRSPQGGRPTIYGKALIEWSVAVFQLKQRIGKIEFLSDRTSAEVRIGCVPSMAAPFSHRSSADFPANIHARSSTWTRRDRSRVESIARRLPLRPWRPNQQGARHNY
jgi:DNA-binding transcriptional LysR family regulator